jgi:DNA-binding GntR family transcriptional regulator
MMEHGSLARGPLRDEVRDILIDRLADGSFSPGSRLRDQAIAEELGISRTPVREALTSLVDEGLVVAVPNRGFRAPPLAPREPREVYPLIWTLEVYGLEASPAFAETRLEELRRLNERLARQVSSRDRLQLDDAWHATLLARCGNERLVAILEGLKRQVRRYEIAFLRDAERAALSIEDHDAVVRALEGGDRAAAARALRRNWSMTRDTIVAWLSGADSSLAGT